MAKRKRTRRNRKSYSMSERNSFKKGYWKGFFIGRKSKKKKSNKKSNSLPKQKKVNKDWIIAQRYARHMGNKFGLPERDVKVNAREHYAHMKRDKNYRDELLLQYGSDL